MGDFGENGKLRGGGDLKPLGVSFHLGGQK
jgi:hypothetical protein